LKSYLSVPNFFQQLRKRWNIRQNRRKNLNKKIISNAKIPFVFCKYYSFEVSKYSFNWGFSVPIIPLAPNLGVAQEIRNKKEKRRVIVNVCA